MPIQRYTQREIIKQVSCLCKKPVVWHGENLPHTSTRERKEAGSILNVRAFHPPHVTFSLRDTVRCNCITEESGPPIFSSQIVGNHATMALWHSCFPCAVHHSLFPLCVLQCAWQRAIQTSKVFHSTITTKWEVKTVSRAEAPLGLLQACTTVGLDLSCFEWLRGSSSFLAPLPTLM